MSLSRPQIQNPAVRFYDWSGSRGQLEYWDKEKGEKGERIAVKLPFKFIVLDELHTITGFSDPDQSGYWANEVRRTTDDLTVRTKRGVKYVGPYKDGRGIKQVPSDSKYAKSVYIAQKLNDEWVLANLKLSGVALTAWIDLNGKHRTEGNITALTGSTEGSKGATKFQIPTFEYGGAPTGEALEVATGLDAALQNYLDTYLSAPKFDENTGEDLTTTYVDTEGATAEQTQDFEERKAAKLSPKEDRDEDRAIKEMLESDEAESINIDDTPF